MKVDIICPSMGRAEKVHTKQFINDLTIVVPEKEVELYEEYNPECTIVGTPKEIRGITKTRQFILDNWKDNATFMIDDDVTEIRENWKGEGEYYLISDPLYVKDIIYQTADVARMMGIQLWGFCNCRRPLEFDSHEPIRHKGYLNNSYLGFSKGHNLMYDTSFSEGEDHYINCLNKYKNRSHLMENRWTFKTQDNFKSSGGCSGYRTIDGMKANTLRLKKLFGDAISFKQPSSGKKNIYEGERSISFPF